MTTADTHIARAVLKTGRKYVYGQRIRDAEFWLLEGVCGSCLPLLFKWSNMVW